MINEGIALGHLIVVVASVVLCKRGGKDLLGLLFSVFLLTSNLFITKEMLFCGLTITTCDVYTIGSILCLNLIQEIYGKKESRKWLYRGVVVLIIFLIMSFFQKWYIPITEAQSYDVAFKLIFTYTLRIVLASLAVTVVSDRVDMFIFQKVKKCFPNLPFVCRFLSSTILSQLLDTLLFSFLALYGVVSCLWDCIWVAYFIKVIFIIGSAFYFLFTKKDFYKPVTEDS